MNRIKKNWQWNSCWSIFALKQAIFFLSIDSELSKKSSEETEISQKLSDSTETDLTESSKKSSEETDGRIEGTFPR